jgi:outer membrane cobalamin receptor
MYETFPVNVIERIEVIRVSRFCTLWFTGFSAVINVVTKALTIIAYPSPVPLENNLQNNINANVNYKIGDFGIVLAGRYGDKSGWQMTGKHQMVTVVSTQ